MPSMSNPTYAYFDIRGVQFPVRLMLAYTAEPHTTKEYAVFDAARDPKNSLKDLLPLQLQAEAKREGEWFADKQELGLDFPSLPYLDFGKGRIFNQTTAIAHYLARKHHLEADGDEKSRCLQEMLLGVYNDQIGRFRGGVILVPHENAEQAHAMFKQGMLPAQLKPIERFIGEKLFFLGDKVTTADFFMFDLLDIYQRFSPETVEGFPKVKAFIERFRSLPAIAKLHKEHPEYVYPINPGFASWGTS